MEKIRKEILEESHQELILNAYWDGFNSAIEYLESLKYVVIDEHGDECGLGYDVAINTLKEIEVKKIINILCFL